MTTVKNSLLCSLTINAEQYDRITGFNSAGRTATIEFGADRKWHTKAYEPTHLVKWVDADRATALHSLVNYLTM